MRQLLRRAWYLIRRRRFDADLREELEFHRASIERELLASGSESTEARFSARRALGSVALAQDHARDVWVPRALQGFGQDVRLAFRTLRATPIVTAVAVLSLALGIGANTAIFSLVNSLMLRTLPVKDPGELVRFTNGPAGVGAEGWSYAIWDQIRQRPQLFAGTAAWSPTQFDLASGGETRFVDGSWVSGSFFETLGVSAWLGRTFSNADDLRDDGVSGPVTVISYRFWQGHFGGTADVIGHTLVLNAVPFTIVGVTPPNFFGVEVGRTFDVMVPLGDEPLVRGQASFLDQFVLWLKIMGRLKPGQTAEAATAALRGVQPQIRQATFPTNFSKPALDRYWTQPFALIPSATGTSMLRSLYARPLVTLLVVVAIVLMIACANIANLLLARATARRHELSVRVALGASRWRLVRQLLTESVVLALIGTAIGMLIATWGSRLLLRQLSTPGGHVLLDLAIDWRVLAFTVGTAVATALLSGTAPALRTSAVAPIGALKEDDRTTLREARVGFASGLVVAQVALSVMLVVAAGLFLHTFASLATRDLGFSRARILLVTMDAPAALGVDRRLPLYEGVREVVRGLPGVGDAALSLDTPVGGGVFAPRIEVSGGSAMPETVAPGVPPPSFGNLISPGWLSTYGTPLIAGRDITDRDRPNTAPVVLVNQAFARVFLNGASPLGHTIHILGPARATLPAMEVVGVVGDAVYASLRDPVPPTLYMPFAQHMNESMFLTALASVSLSVRATVGAPSALTRSIAAAVGGIRGDVSLTFRPLAEQIDASLVQERLIAMLSGFFGGLALLLAGLGLYGVTTYAVRRRWRELGIRMALGAAPLIIVRLVLSRVSVLVGLGVVLGTVASLWATRFVTSLLYGLQPHDAPTLIAAVAVLVAVSIAAGWIPAWRASRIDPAMVLRNE